LSFKIVFETLHPKSLSVMTLLHNMHLFQCISTIVGFLASPVKSGFFGVLTGQTLKNLDLLTVKIPFFKEMYIPSYVWLMAIRELFLNA